MTAPPDNKLTNIESDIRTECTQRFRLKGRTRRCLDLTTCSTSPEASDFLPGFAEIPGTVSTC